MARSYAKVIIAMLIWGSLALFVRNIPYASAEIVMFRIIFGFIFLFGVWALSKRKIDEKVLKENLPRLLISGVIMGANWAALFESYIYVDVSIATLGYYCAPVFVVIASAFIFKEKITFSKAVAVIGAVAGMVIITGVKMGGIDPARGFVFSLISAVLYSMVTLFNKTFKGLDGLETTIFQLIGAAIVMIPYALITHKGGWVMPSFTGGVSILILGFVHTGIALYLYFSAIQELPAQSVALCSYIDPVSAIIFAAIFLNETLTPIQIFGAVLIIGSAIFGEIYGRKKKTE